MKPKPEYFGIPVHGRRLFLEYRVGNATLKKCIPRGALESRRDLFDLWMGLIIGNTNPAGTLECFDKHMESENHSVSGKNYRHNLESLIKDTRFLSEGALLIRSDTEYDAGTAMELIMDLLVSAL